MLRWSLRNLPCANILQLQLQLQKPPVHTLRMRMLGMASCLTQPNSSWAAHAQPDPDSNALSPTGQLGACQPATHAAVCCRLYAETAGCLAFTFLHRADTGVPYQPSEAGRCCMKQHRPRAPAASVVGSEAGLLQSAPCAGRLSAPRAPHAAAPPEYS